jgi:adenylate cyclase
MRREWEKGISLGYQAVALEPSGADVHNFLGFVLYFADKPEEAIPVFKKAIRLNPITPAWYLHGIALAFRMLGQYDKGIKYSEEAAKRSPGYFLAHLHLSGCYMLAGREEEARAEAKEVLRLNPSFSLDKWEKTLALKNLEEKKRFIDSLRKAGLR